MNADFCWSEAGDEKTVARPSTATSETINLRIRTSFNGAAV
jgi:hypothetical protein